MASIMDMNVGCKRYRDCILWFNVGDACPGWLLWCRCLYKKDVNGPQHGTVRISDAERQTVVVRMTGDLSGHVLCSHRFKYAQ